MKWACLEGVPWLDEESLTCFIWERARGALYHACWAELYPELRIPSNEREHSARSYSKC